MSTYEQPPAATPPSPATPEPSGFSGLFQDPSTLASTGLIAAVLFAVVAGFLNFLDPPLIDDFKNRMIALTDTVDVGDVALLGIAVALLLLTPDPPGGVPRSLLMQAAAALSGLIAVFGVIRALVVWIDSRAFLSSAASCLATLGVALAAFTVAFYAAKESFLKEKGQI